MAEKLPLTANLRWFQVLYGAVTAVVCYQIWESSTGAVPLSGAGLVWRILLVAFGFFVFIVYLQNVYRFGLIPDYSKKCRFCNGPVNRYSEFCEHCGADLVHPEKLVACPRCGAEVFEGTPHCPECGASMSRGKGKKGKPKAKPAREPQEGWDTPIDALSGLPPRDDP